MTVSPPYHWLLLISCVLLDERKAEWELILETLFPLKESFSFLGAGFSA